MELGHDGEMSWYAPAAAAHWSHPLSPNPQVTLPLGLGVAVVQGIREGGANHHEPHDSKEEASAPLCQAERGEISVAEAKKLQVESEEEELVPPGGLEQPANCDGLPRIGGGNSLGSRGSTGSRARLSIDVKERLKEIAPKVCPQYPPDFCVVPLCAPC